MSTLNTEQYLIPTYVRFFMSDWDHLCRFIIEQGTPMKERMLSDSKEPHQPSPMPTDLQLNNALNGPYQAIIKLCFKYYAHIIRVRLEITMADSEFFKRSQSHVNPHKIPETLLKTINLAECDHTLKKMNDTIKHCIDAWKKEHSRWSHQVLAILSDNIQLSFSELEVKAFLDDEPISDILDQYTDLKIALPPLKGRIDWVSYYSLKSTLALHSLFARCQRPAHSQKLQSWIKPLKRLFHDIHKQEVPLLFEQKKTLENLTSAFCFNKHAR